MTRRKKNPQQLKVVFETSVLVTHVASDLLRSEIREFIIQNSQHGDLDVSWHLPSIVIDERRYQMQQRAFELLPSLQKLETLLGHNLNINEDILITRVDEAIDRQMAELNLSAVVLDTNQIDLQDIIRRAVFRDPPFNPGEKEKGFRDAMIAETFLQLVATSPTTASVCRLAFVTNDKLLEDYVKERTSGSQNVRILPSVNELEGLINTLVSEVTEEFVEGLSEKVRKYFFEKGNNNSLFYKERIPERIIEDYGKQINEVPQAGQIRENGRRLIGPPIFVRKERQRLFWITHIRLEAKLFRHEFPEPPTTGPEVPTYRALSFADIFPPQLHPISTIIEAAHQTQAVAGSPKKIEVGTGQTVFEVHWSVNLTQANHLTSPKIETLKCLGTTWN